MMLDSLVDLYIKIDNGLRLIGDDITMSGTDKRIISTLCKTPMSIREISTAIGGSERHLRARIVLLHSKGLVNRSKVRHGYRYWK